MFSKLAIAITDRCSAACDMCCFGCSPEGKHILSNALMKDVIRQARDLKGMNAVGFTGGEPFMVFDRLLECAAYAKSLDFPVTVNTNGFWARNESKAREQLKALKEAGVVLLSFSADRYHQQYVPIEDLKAALRLTLEAGMKTDISVLEGVGSDDIVRMTEALRPEIYQTSLINHPMLPVGKALETMKPGDFIRHFETKEAKCPFVGMVQINFDGNYYMCCSQFCRDIPRINLGDAAEVKLADLERRILADDYLYVMLRRGLAWFVDRAREQGFEIPDYLCSPCHCCYYVFRNPELQERIRDQVEAEAGRLRVQHLLGTKA